MGILFFSYSLLSELLFILLFRCGCSVPGSSADFILAGRRAAFFEFESTLNRRTDSMPCELIAVEPGQCALREYVRIIRQVVYLFCELRV